MMPTPEVKRYEVITPIAHSLNDYGDMSVTTSTGQEIRVNKKHIALHPIFTEAASVGRAIKVGWAVFSREGKSVEYVHTAELFDGTPPPEKQVESITAGVEQPSPLRNTTGTSIEAQVAYKGIIELLNSGILAIDGLVGKWALAWGMGKLGATVEDIEKLAKAEATQSKTKNIK